MLHKVSHSPSVFVQVTAGKSLIGDVEEDEVLLLFADFGDALPVLFCWVNTRRVMRASMEENNLLLRSILKTDKRRKEEP